MALSHVLGMPAGAALFAIAGILISSPPWYGVVVIALIGGVAGHAISLLIPQLVADGETDARLKRLRHGRRGTASTPIEGAEEADSAAGGAPSAS